MAYFRGTRDQLSLETNIAEESLNSGTRSRLAHRCTRGEMSAQILKAHFSNSSSLFWARLCDYTDNDGGRIELHLICYLGADGGTEDEAAGVRPCAAHAPEQELLLLPSHEF